MDLRKLINGYLEQSGITKAELLRQLGGKVKKQTLYDYLTGKSDGNGKIIGAILDGLGFEVIPPKPPQFRPPKRRRFASYYYTVNGEDRRTTTPQA